MDDLKEIYKKWRWLTYNEIDEFQLGLWIKEKSPGMIGQTYSQKNIEQYIAKDFSVSQDLIASYDKKIYNKAKSISNTHSNYFFGQFYYLRSIFIENCFINITLYEKDELLDRIKRNLIHYHWWDNLSFTEFSNCITNHFFTKSTCKLISKEKLHKYFEYRFQNRTDFVNYILSHFNPKDKMIKEMNSTHRGRVIYDYNWLFRNELIKAIRIFENECRLEYNQNIVGSFYNESLLFRLIRKEFKNNYNIISQGSPEWLGLQRFDIYFPELNLAIEYQGEQHQRPVDFGGKGEKIAFKQFQENLKRDKEKKAKAERNGCEIIYVYPDYNFNQVINKIKKAIRKRN